MFDWIKALFNESIGADRSQRTLPERLERLGLPPWEEPIELAESLDISIRKLWYFGSHDKSDNRHHYTAFTIPKRSGGERTILAPRRHLKRIQKTLQKTLVDKLPLDDHAHGFRKHHSVKTNAEPHLGASVVIRLDLETFFRTVTFPRIQGLLLHCGYDYRIATIIAVLTTGSEVLDAPLAGRYCVQGAPTSPGLCNAIARRLDTRLAGLADSMGYTYTRYADDLTFSGPDDGQIGNLLGTVETIVSDEGFRLNRDKTRVMRDGSRKEVTGVVVNETLGLSRQKRRRIRAEIHQMKIARDRGQLDPERVDRLEGKLAYISMINPTQGAKLRAQWNQ